MIAMAENGIDVSHLADGTYTVEIEMWTASFNGLSMSNGAIHPQATLKVKDQIGTMTIDFKPIMQLGYYGSLFQLWVFDGNTPADGKATYTAHSGDPSYMHEAAYPSFQIVNFNSGAVKPIEGLPAEQPTLENEVRPAAASITLPYMGSSNDYNKIYCYLGVDMMRQIGVGDQPAILYIKYSTLKAESVNETLSTDTSPMNLLIGGKQMTEAKVLGGSGWTITAESNMPDVASVSMEQGKITVTGLRQGSATITVTASKDGQSSLRKEFTVNVAPTGSTAVKASGGTVTGGMAQYTIDGNFIVTNESSVYAIGDEITIAADHAASGAEITITADAARTLSAASKSIVVQTAQGSIALNPALMRIVSARALGSYFHVAMNGVAAADRMFRLLDLPEPAAGTKDVQAGDLTIRNLTYSYGGGKDALKNVTLTVRKGGFVSICGASGCGKSTLAAILSGVRSGYKGSAAIGGTELQDASPESLRHQLTVVSANSYLFAGTVRQALREGAPGVPDEALLEVLERVKLLDFVMEQGGLDMPLAERASNLSGGQRQRLALARALLKDSPIYIFDEATSNIDSESEESIMEAIYGLKGRHTVLLISHRLANAVHSDRIAFLKNGVLWECGTHEELLKENNGYAAMYSAQRKLEDLERKEDLKCGETA